MNFSYVKRLLMVAVIGLCPLIGNADDATKPSFQSICIDSWMKKGGEVKDQVDYKNFGEKYCGCAASQTIDSEAAVQKAIQLCLSRTLLHDAMDNLEEEVGLSEAKDTDINEYCEDRWNLIYPKQSDEDKKFTMAYCTCASPKLLELIKQSENITDKEYADNIDTIAAACSGDVKEEKSTTPTMPKQ